MSEIMVRRRSQRLSVPETSSPFNGIIDRPVSKVLSPLSPKIQNQIGKESIQAMRLNLLYYKIKRSDPHLPIQPKKIPGGHQDQGHGEVGRSYMIRVRESQHIPSVP